MANIPERKIGDKRMGQDFVKGYELPGGGRTGAETVGRGQ